MNSAEKQDSETIGTMYSILMAAAGDRSIKVTRCHSKATRNNKDYLLPTEAEYLCGWSFYIHYFESSVKSLHCSNEVLGRV